MVPTLCAKQAYRIACLMNVFVVGNSLSPIPHWRNPVDSSKHEFLRYQPNVIRVTPRVGRSLELNPPSTSTCPCQPGCLVACHACIPGLPGLYPSPPLLIMDCANLPPGVSLPSALDQAKIPRLPATAYYVPNFISVEEERNILDKVRSPL